MIMTTSRPDAHRVQLCTISGNRIGLRIDDFLALSLSGTTIGAALIFSVFALLSGTVFGSQMSVLHCAIYWPAHIAAVWAIVVMTFMFLDWIARKTRRKFILVTFGVQVLALLITVPLGHAIIHQTTNVPHLVQSMTLAEFSRHLAMVLTFEFVLTWWIWPPMMRQREMVAEKIHKIAPKTHYVGPMCTVAIYRKHMGKEQITEAAVNKVVSS